MNDVVLFSKLIGAGDTESIDTIYLSDLAGTDRTCTIVIGRGDLATCNIDHTVLKRQIHSIFVILDHLRQTIAQLVDIAHRTIGHTRGGAFLEIQDVHLAAIVFYRSGNQTDLRAPYIHRQ